MSNVDAEEILRQSMEKDHHQRRERIATACMAAIMVWRGDSTPVKTAATAVAAADALIAALERSK